MNNNKKSQNGNKKRHNKDLRKKKQWREKKKWYWVLIFPQEWVNRGKELSLHVAEYSDFFFTWPKTSSAPSIIGGGSLDSSVQSSSSPTDAAMLLFQALMPAFNLHHQGVYLHLSNVNSEWAAFHNRIRHAHDHQWRLLMSPVAVRKG